MAAKILKRDIDIPANKSMEAYFAPKCDKFRGRAITTLLTVTNKDLYLIPAGEHKLKTKNDFDHLRSITEDRTQWRRLSPKIREAAKTSKSEH